MFKSQKLRFLILLVAAAGLTGKPAAADVSIDCDAGQSIQNEISNGETEIEFTGTCTETVSIQQSGTTIRGRFDRPPENNVIAGDVIVFGVQRAFLFNLTHEGTLFVQGNGDATFQDGTLSGSAAVGGSGSANFFNATVTGVGSLNLSDNGRVFMRNSDIVDLRGGLFITNGAVFRTNGTDIVDTDNGIFVGRNATVRFRNGRMGPALVDDVDVSCNPLCLTDGAVVRLDSSIVEGSNEDPGIGGAVSISRNSSVLVRGDSEITNTGSQPAVGVFNDSSFRQDRSGAAAPSTINGDILVTGMSYADVRAAAVNGDVTLRLHSVLRLGSAGFGGDPSNVVLTGNTEISLDSALVVEDPTVTIVGDITCLDGESSLGGDFLGSGQVNCTGFDQPRGGGGHDDDDDDDG